jgi:hypothetical protein
MSLFVQVRARIGVKIPIDFPPTGTHLTAGGEIATEGDW